MHKDNVVISFQKVFQKSKIWKKAVSERSYMDSISVKSDIVWPTLWLHSISNKQCSVNIPTIKNLGSRGFEILFN